LPKRHSLLLGVLKGELCREQFCGHEHCGIDAAWRTMKVGKMTETTIAIPKISNPARAIQGILKLFSFRRVMLGMLLVIVVKMTDLQAQELITGAAPGDLESFRARVLPRIDLLPSISHSEKDKLHDLLTRATNLARLFTIHFETANARLVPLEISKIKERMASQQLQTWFSDLDIVIFVLGFGDRPIPKSRDFDIAGSRAQSVTSFLREQCGVRQSIYSLSMREEVDGEAGHAITSRTVEVWAVQP
jgi:hypothetical protein